MKNLHLKCSRFHGKYHECGLTLVEVMITLAILIIMAVIAMPRITKSLPAMRVKASARALVSNMQKAKMEAAKNNTNAVLTFSDGAGGGYTFFVDTNENDTQDSSETVLADVSLPSEISLTSAFSSGTIGFSPLGLPINNSWGNITLALVDNNVSVKQFKVTLSSAGNIRILSSIDGATWN